MVLGCPELGKLLFWERLSETYLLKRQWHDSVVVCLVYSSDGSLVATGGEYLSPGYGRHEDEV